MLIQADRISRKLDPSSTLKPSKSISGVKLGATALSQSGSNARGPSASYPRPSSPINTALDLRNLDSSSPIGD